VNDLMLSLQEQGTTVILVTKELDEFLAQADQVLVLNAGAVVFAGPPQEIIDEQCDYLADELGVWLPEVCELGLGLRKKGLLNGKHIPLTVDHTLSLLEDIQVTFEPSLNGRQSDLDPTGQDVLEVERSALISAQNLRYAYGKREALKGISFEVRRGELLAIVGRNGAGKSTLSKLLVGLLRPMSGKLELFGKDASRWKVEDLAKRLALVFQNPEHQFLTDTVFDEIAYSFLAKGVEEEEELKQSVNRILTMLDLEDVANDHPFALSAGKKRRLGVAAMLVGSPEVLVVDEPTYGQDRAMTKSLMDLILQLRKMGITIIMITHSMRLVEEYVDRAIVMNEGLITFDGKVAELFRCPEILEDASLTVTTLQELLVELSHRNRRVGSNVRTIDAFLDAIVC
jgi:energy-coupling factor transport system ATP-binding protein